MNTQEKIKKELLKIWDASRVNATNIFQGSGRYGYGWYIQEFGKAQEHLGKTAKEALTTLAHKVAYHQENYG